MKKKNIAALIFAGIMVFVLTACGGYGNNTATTGGKTDSSDSSTKAAAADGDVYTVTIAHQYNDSNPIAKTINENLIPNLEEKSGGRLQEVLHGNAELGGETDMVSLCQTGAVSITIMGESSASLDPAVLNIWTLPYLFQTEAAWDAATAADGEIAQKMNANLPSVANISICGYLENGYKQITTKKPINQMSDLKGLKIRVSPCENELNSMEAFGANGTQMSFTELFSALETGTVDGQDNAYSTIYSSSLYEVQDYIADTHHLLSTQFLIRSEKFYNDLPDDLKVIFDECVSEFCRQQALDYRNGVEADRQKCLDEGMEETTPDLTEWIDAAQSVYEKYYEQYPEAKDLVEEILSLPEQG